MKLTQILREVAAQATAAQTFGQFIKWDFKKNGKLEIRDKNGKPIYWEFATGFWTKVENDSKGNRTYYEDSNGRWLKNKYDSRGKLIYWEDSSGRWAKMEHDSRGKLIYFENSDGVIKDYRPKNVT